MSTKNECLDQKRQQGQIHNGNLETSFTNLVLNQSHKCSPVISLQSKSVLRKFHQKDNDDLSDNTRESHDFKTWNNKFGKCATFSEHSNHSEFKNVKENRAESGKNDTNSTLSLHIIAYENSIQPGEDEWDNSKQIKPRPLKSLENVKQLFTTTSIKSPFEFPRQQRNEKYPPEVMHYKHSQRLNDSYERHSARRNERTDYHNQNNSDRARMSVPNIPRIGYRPNIYARPQVRTPTPAPPRPPVPSSRNRMLKPGFETSTTPYSRPPAHRTQEKSPEPPPRNLEPYPVLSTFMFTEEQLQNTPSLQQHNISYDEEITLRRSGTFFIRELCRRLNAPYVQKSSKISPRAMCVSMVYFHRFYMFHSITTFNPMHLGTACLFLAAKCEECPRKLSHFSKQLYSMLHPDDPHLLEPDELEPMNDLITALETSVLSTLAFELNIDLPHVDIIQAPYVTGTDRLRKMAYHLTTDLLATTTLCIQYESKALAAACFFVAAAYLDINMEKDFGEKWFLLLDKNLTEDVLVKIVKSFTAGLHDCKHIISAERIPRPNDTPRAEPSKAVSEVHSQNTPESRIKDASKEVRPQVRDNRSRERVLVQEHHPPPSSEGRSRDRPPQKEQRISEPPKKERPRAPYDQSRDRSADTFNKDRPRAPNERRTPDISQQHRSKASHERAPDASFSADRTKAPEISQHHRPKAECAPASSFTAARTKTLEQQRRSKESYERNLNVSFTSDRSKAPEMTQPERHKKASRTPEAPAYESIKPSRGYRTPEVPESHRSKVPYEKSQDYKHVKSEPLSQEIPHIAERRTPEAPHHEHVKTIKEEHVKIIKEEHFKMIKEESRDKPEFEKPIRERSREIQPPHRPRDLEAPLLVPPPLPPPSSELRNKRKLPAEEEVPQKRPVDTSHHSTSNKQRFEQVDFSLPPPPLPPPYDRRISMPVREQSESSQKHNFPKVPTYSTPQQQGTHNDHRRDETRHHRGEHHRSNANNQFGGGSSRDTSLQHPQQQPQKDVRKREMMQNFVPAQTNSPKSVNRHPQKAPTSEELEEGEIE